MGILPDWMIERDVKIEPFSPQQERPGVISYGVTSYGYDVRVGYKWKVFDAIAGGVVDPKNFNPKLLREFDLSPECPACDGHGSKMYEWGVAAMKACGGKRVPFSDGRPGFYYVDDKGREMGLKTIGGPCGECKGTKKNKDASDFITIPPNSYALGESMETFTIPRDVACVCVGKSTYARCGIIVNVTPGEPEWEGKWTIEISNSSPLPAIVYCGEGIMQCMFIRSDGSLQADIDHLRMAFLNKFGTAWSDYDEEELETHRRNGTCKVSYKDKKGKYQGQGGLTLPKVEK